MSSSPISVQFSVLSNAKALAVIAPGIRGGKENILIKTLQKELSANSIGTVTFDFSFYDDNQGPIVQGSENDLICVLNQVVDKYPHKKIHLIGKSYGGLISSMVLPYFEIQSLAVFGFLISYNETNFILPTSEKLYIIHGENDKYFSPKQVSQFTSQYSNTEMFVVPGADHGLGDQCFKFIGKKAIKWYIDKLITLP